MHTVSKFQIYIYIFTVVKLQKKKQIVHLGNIVNGFMEHLTYHGQQGRDDLKRSLGDAVVLQGGRCCQIDHTLPITTTENREKSII